MSATPQTDEFEEKMDLSKDQDELLALARKLESAAADAAARLSVWETGFETTNAAQAVAEHKAVLAKRDALLAEVQRLTEGSRSIKRSNEALQAELAVARQEIEDIKRAPDKPQESAQ